MRVGHGLVLLAGVLAFCVCIGCESDSDSSSGSGGGGALGGTWNGAAAGRTMTMVLNQNGTSLTGNYTFQNPTFSENISGTLSSETPPATATLVGGADRRFEVTFNSANSMSGGFYKGATQVGSVAASK